MGKYNRFAFLKGYDGSGYKQIAGATQYKKLGKAKSELVGGGLCAAMSMRWVQMNTQPTTFNDYAEVALAQEDYANLTFEIESADVATQMLAKEFDLAVETFWPIFDTARSEQEAADRSVAYWEQLGTPGAAVVKFVDGELTDARPKFPLIIVFFLAATVEAKDGVIYEDGDIDDAKADYSPAHAVALKRFMRATGEEYYQYYDPNAGVYEIEDGRLDSFFEIVATSYEDFAIAYDDDDEFPWKIRYSLKPVTIYSLVPR